MARVTGAKTRAEAKAPVPGATAQAIAPEPSPPIIDAPVASPELAAAANAELAKRGFANEESARPSNEPRIIKQARALAANGVAGEWQLEVTGPAPGRRRANRAFGAEVSAIPLDTLDEGDLVAIVNDRLLQKQLVPLKPEQN